MELIESEVKNEALSAENEVHFFAKVTTEEKAENYFDNLNFSE